MIHDQLFAVIDVETTGGGISGNRITEICIVLLKGNKILDKYTTLVNPEKYIPIQITALTGIDNEMVADAPTFAEVAAEIDKFTANAVFVAHNVSFDYNVLRNEFKLIGFDYNRKKLCTVRLARKLIPGLPSYSLGRLCDSINIPLNNRHRAEGDTDATVILFSRLLSLDFGFETIKLFLNARSQQATLPPHLSAEQFQDLPTSPGIYLFKDQKHKIIYVGKAKNIKKRVLSHFYDKNSKEYHLGQETYFIDHETTGSELLALLLEAEMIRKNFPKYNRAQKWPIDSYQIIHYENRRGIIQLALTKDKNKQDTLNTFYNRTAATERLERICEDFHLCPRFCTLQSQVEKCSHYRIKNCEGICEGTETVAAYNQKVLAALEALQSENHTYIICEKGRKDDEQAFVIVKDSQYQGFGYVDKNECFLNLNGFEPFLQKQKATYHTHAIIRSHLSKNGGRNVIYLEGNNILAIDNLDLSV